MIPIFYKPLFKKRKAKLLSDEKRAVKKTPDKAQ
jgi:hypothetical protein